MKSIILPGNLLDKNKPDDLFVEEYNAAKQFGKVFFFNIEDFAKEEILNNIPNAEVPGEEIFYHGWMMNLIEYTRLYTTLKNKGYKLTNNPHQHDICNNFDGWYPLIKDLSPPSIMIYETEVRPILDAALAFQREHKSGLIIKDAVKSLKHDWYEACFIPANANPFQMAKVIGTFLSAKKSHNDLKLPVVLRKFENLKPMGIHSKSKMPISYEFRTYVRNGKVFLQAEYWEKVYDEVEAPPSALIETIIQRVRDNCGSNLFTIDTALKEDGTWTCIEVGDGQVSMLPDRANKVEFFEKLLMENK